MTRFNSYRDGLSESLWFIPGLCMTVATAAVLVRLDRMGHTPTGLVGFTGGPESARSILSTIGSSVLVLTGLVFSITVLALQLTSSQFSPGRCGHSCATGPPRSVWACSSPRSSTCS